MAVALFRSQALQGKVPALAHGADIAAVRRRDGEAVPDVQLLLPLPRGTPFDSYGAPKTEDVQFVADTQEREAQWDNKFHESSLHQEAGTIRSTITRVRRSSMQAVELAALVVARQGAVDARIAEQDRKMQLVKLSTQMLLDQYARRKMRDSVRTHGRRQSFSCGSAEMKRWGKLRTNAHEVGHKRIMRKEVQATREVLRKHSNAGGDVAGLEARPRTSRRHASVTGASQELEQARELAVASVSLQLGQG